QDLGALVGFQQRVERGDGEAGLETAEHGHDELPAVRNDDRQPVAGATAANDERAREGAGARVEVAVRELATVPREGRRAGTRACRRLELRREISHGFATGVSARAAFGCAC